MLKNEQHLNIEYNFDHQMSLSKSKILYSDNCLHFLKRAVPLLDLYGMHLELQTLYVTVQHE